MANARLEVSTTISQQNDHPVQFIFTALRISTVLTIYLPLLIYNDHIDSDFADDFLTSLYKIELLVASVFAALISILSVRRFFIEKEKREVQIV